MTKEQTDIFKVFGVRLPDYDTLEPTVPKKSSEGSLNS